MVCDFRPQDVVIFIIGGTTYEEARTVALHNVSNSGTRFILGGSVVLNSKRYYNLTPSFVLATLFSANLRNSACLFVFVCVCV